MTMRMSLRMIALRLTCNNLDVKVRPEKHYKTKAKSVNRIVEIDYAIHNLKYIQDKFIDILEGMDINIKSDVISDNDIRITITKTGLLTVRLNTLLSRYIADTMCYTYNNKVQISELKIDRILLLTIKYFEEMSNLKECELFNTNIKE